MEVGLRKTEKQDRLYYTFYETLESHLNMKSSQVNESRNLYNIGVYDDLFKLIEKAHSDPLGIVSDQINNSIYQIHQFLSSMVFKFFDQTENIRHAAVAENHNNGLYFYIVLEDNSLQGKKPFLNFIADYDMKPISKRIPILFDFVSLEVFQELQKEYTVHGQLSKSSKA